MNDNGAHKKPRRRPKLWHILLVLLLVLAAVYGVWRVRLRRKIRARLDAIAAEGYPTTLEELNAWYTIPASAENAADVLLEAFSRCVKWKNEYLKDLPLAGKAQLPPRRQPLPARTRALIADYLADNQEALELLHKGAAIEHCRYPIDLSAGFECFHPYLSDIRSGVKLLALEAALHAEDGEPEKAVRSVRAGFGLTHSLANEPTQPSQLVRIACEAICVSGLERVLYTFELADGQLLDISEVLADAEACSKMRIGIALERVAGIDFIRDIPAEVIHEYAGSIPSVPLIRLYRELGLGDRDAVTYLDLMDQYLQVMEFPLHQRKREAEAVEARARKALKSHMLLRFASPVLAKLISIDLRRIARLRAARTGLAVERFRLAKGRLPEALAELVPDYLEAVPKDPFDGADLRYRRLERGYVVYSIGEDEVDDGGKEKPQRRERREKQPNYDVTFIVER